jgi:creatinine amidohydrolase
MELDTLATHASWMENFPWTRIAGVQYPQLQKARVDYKLVHSVPSAKAREILGDGNFGGYYQRPDEDMQELWRIGVEETREVIANNWPR